LEADRQPKALVGEAKIGEKLLLVDREERLDGFDFDDDLVFDDQMGPEAGLDTNELIDQESAAVSPCQVPDDPGPKKPPERRLQARLPAPLRLPSAPQSAV
jgi:hypothetical protein